MRWDQQKDRLLEGGLFVGVCQIEKDGEVSALFIPNLTINLTYLCYGIAKLLVLQEITKEFYKI